MVELCGAQLGLIRTLRGSTETFGCLSHDHYQEVETERRFATNKNLVIAEFFYWTRKLQARIFAGDHAAAVAAARNAETLLWVSSAMFECAEYHLYGALARAAAWDAASADEQPEHFAALKVHHRQLEIWGEHNPVTFEDRVSIVGAEIARIEGRTLDAEELYEKAIRAAHTSGFVHDEAFANELAGRFYAARGFDKIATVYLRDARYCYLRWEAHGKVLQLDRQFPLLRADRPSELKPTIEAAVEHLDLATVIKVSEALSGEIVLEKLVDTLMRTALEHAGAERGLLILPHESDHRIEAEATIGDGQVKVDLRHTPVAATDLPESVFRHVARTKESILLHDASGRSEFSTDEYVLAHRARSVLCLPILKQARLLGILYLENSLTPHAFTPSRMSFLKLLASEAAISMENARLYRDLAEREARIRRLVDANIIGIFIWDLQGRILEANDAFLTMVGYSREDLASQPVRWTQMTPPEWRERDERHWVPELKATGILQPFEKEFFRKDGSRVPILLGAATFEDDKQQGVAFVVDLTERKLTADALRGLQTDLAHANRLATMGQLVASIAHEVNQPIGAARNNAYAALRFLAAQPPNLVEVGEALESVVKETYRAGDIIAGIRNQVKKLPPRKEGVDLNGAIEQVTSLVRGEFLKHRVSVQMALADGLPLVHADRVQLQQVVLNLILNAIEALVSVEDTRRLVVKTEPNPSGGLLITVADSGPGIAPQDRDRVFESFFTTKAGGVGIGLSICRSIIDSHSGQLWVEANEPRGAVFRLRLPAHN